MSKILILFAFVLLCLNRPAQAQLNSGFATVLIDMQEGFYARGGTTDSEKLKKLVGNQIRLLKWSVQNNVPVLIFEYVGFGKTDPKLMQIIKNHTYKVIQKNTDGGFYSISKAETLATLKDWDVDALIVAGINGPYCVKSTIEGALENGYDVMTTAWVIGNINHNPPTFPNGAWYFKNAKFTVFPTLDSIIQ